MAAVEATPNEGASREAPPVEAAPTQVGLVAGDPLALGLPAFIAGSVALGLVLVGQVGPTAVGASLPIIMAATALFLFVATIWAAATGASAVASVFGVFGGFWLSYAFLVLGLVHNWFGIGAADVTSTQELFLTTWLIVIVLLTVATLRLPLAFTGVLVLVDVALLLVLLGTIQGSTGLLKAGGVVALVFALLGAYIFAGCLGQATGGSAVPLGKPVIRS